MDRRTAHQGDAPSPAPSNPPGELTRILSELRHGDMEARGRLVALVYEDLRALAAAYLGRERPGHTLQPTALVHEAFCRLFGNCKVAWDGRAHFFGAAGEAMRRILVDYARRRRALKRGGGAERTALTDEPAEESCLSTVLAVDEALGRLGDEHERKRKLVELRFFAGLSLEEAAATLEISPATAKRDWAFAKAWLYRELGDRNRTAGLDGNEDGAPLTEPQKESGE